MEDKIKELLGKTAFDINDLVDIVVILRSENGCPWDKVQTHKTIKKDFLEEVYEVMEAIDCDSPEMMREELGDVLLQVVFHTVLETEENHFGLDEVITDICQKLIIRHPHVFGDVNADNVDTVLKNWDNIKKETKGQETYTDTLKSVPKNFPALMRAQKLGKRASRAGLDYEDAKDAYGAMESEVSQLEVALLENNKTQAARQLGEIMFSCVNIARKMGLDAEEVLTDVNERFIERFERTEQMARQKESDMTALSIDELEAYWQKAKNNE
ncbi:nucleoside triphosphate pyrophosphohydrolase [Ruminococcus sp.]|uniref:nucleoside triphosphate pyrophosphohydrolase n=1 Tax=Ruminococcus sp. TaxID=41978 RepID=UPI0025F7F2C5|nr:nucleoside triphosphate pyrophosphohydrolase [Ruminococcus sp.]